MKVGKTVKEFRSLQVFNLNTSVFPIFLLISADPAALCINVVRVCVTGEIRLLQLLPNHAHEFNYEIWCLFC